VPRLKLSKLLDERERVLSGGAPATRVVTQIMTARPRIESCAVGALPSARRERKNLSACSPLMARWFELQRRNSEARGGAVTKAAQHAFICNSDARFAEEARLVAEQHGQTRSLAVTGLGFSACSRRARMTALGGSGRLDTPEGVGAGHWAPSCCLGCSGLAASKLSNATAFDHQARGAQTYREFGREASKRHDRWMGAFGRRGADYKSEMATAHQASLAS
jgi:hypothetical protein